MVSTTSGKANRAVMTLGALESIVVISTFWFALSASLASAQKGPNLPRQLIDRSDVHCVHHDDVGFVWLCTNVGLVRFDGENAVTFGGATGLRALVRVSDDRFWVGGTSGLYEFDLNGVNSPESALVRVKSDIDLGSVNALVKLGNGSIACATDYGAWLFADGRFTELALGLPSSPSDRIVHAFAEIYGRFGRDAPVPRYPPQLWATSSGLYVRWSEIHTTRLTTADGLPDNDVQAIAWGVDGRIWIGTRRGLAFIDLLELRTPLAVQRFSDVDVLHDADVRVLRVDLPYLWVGTANGVATLTSLPDTLSKYSRYRMLTHGPVRALSDGSPNVFVADSEVRLLGDRRINHGRTVITAVRVDGQRKPVPWNGVKRIALTLPWNARKVEIQFVNTRRALTERLFMPDDLSYQLRTGLLGERDAFSDTPSTGRPDRISASAPHVADDWQIRNEIFIPVAPGYWFKLPAGHGPLSEIRTVGPAVLRRAQDDGPPGSFASRYIITAGDNGWLTLPREAEHRVVIEHPARTLDAGRHILVVYAAAPGGDDGDAASVEFVVVAAPWVRWLSATLAASWFVGPMTLAIVASALVYRRRQQRGRAKEIAALRSRIAADLHDSVGASLSRIAILSDVVAQQTREQMPEAAPSLNAIGDNARTVIDEMSDAVWFIDPEIRNVRQLLVRIRTTAAQLFELDNITWTVDASDAALAIELTSEQRRHVYLLVKEALTNVRRHAHPASVAVRVELTATGLRVEIADDGAAQANRPSGNATGNGIRNMKARAIELGGTLTMELRVPGPGTRVVLQTSLH